MFTFDRLDQAFNEAKVLPLDDSSRYVIMSDMHRGDNSFSDEFASNQNIFLHAINHYYQNNFHLIENGDGDELWEHENFDYIYYAHQDVFSIYKKFYEKGRLSLIYGNHNMQLRYKEKIEKTLWKVMDPYLDEPIDFLPGIESYEAIRLRMDEFDKDIFIVHGHQGDLLNDYFWRIAQFLLRHVWRYLHIVGFRNPASPAKSHVKRHNIERKYQEWIQRKEQIMITGHTHRAKFSMPEDHLPYFNSGSCVRPRMIHALEIVGGSISLVEWKTWPNINGILQVKKRITEGPVSLSKYI